MIKVVLFGSGNVAIHLAKALQKSKNIDLIQRYTRSNHNTDYFDKSIPAIHHIKSIKAADIYIIAIFDDAISEFSKQLKFEKGLVVHTSGSLSFEKLKEKDYIKKRIKLVHIQERLKHLHILHNSTKSCL